MSSPPSPSPDRSPAGLGLLVATSGAATLGAEIAAARLLAPYFGASTLIWANTIAVVLVALSVGYWLGGRMADRHPFEPRLRVAVLIATALLAAVPFVAGPFFGVVITAFDELEAGAFAGSLFAVLTLVAAPLVILGMVSPWAIRLALTSVAGAGSVAGRLYALSTIGSLVGVFAAALVLVPFAGTQRTFIILAAALALVAAFGLPRRALLVPAALTALLLLPPGATKPAEDPGTRVLYERESPYQYVRVLGTSDGVRRLELNEGQATHSTYRPDTVLTRGVWDGYLVLPFAVLRQPARRFAMLGNAAGTVSRAFGRFFPRTAIDGVELDGAVTEAGRRYFGLDDANPRLRIFTEDARPFLRRRGGTYDLIGIDAYRQPYIPFYLTTEEFFALARSRLAPGGAVVVNVGHPVGQDALERALARSLRSSFAFVARWPIADTNTLLLASNAPMGPDRLRARAADVPAQLRPLLLRAARELRPPLGDGARLTDDRAPVEWLVDESIIDYAGDAR